MGYMEKDTSDTCSVVLLWVYSRRVSTVKASRLLVLFFCLYVLRLFCFFMVIREMECRGVSFLPLLTSLCNPTRELCCLVPLNS